MGCRFALRDGPRQADEDSRGLQYLPGTFARVAADCFQDHINIVDHLLKLRLLIVNDLIRAEAEQEVAVFRRRGSDHISAAPVSDLNGKGSDPASGPMDQHALTRRQTRVIEKGLPDRQRGKWDGRGPRVIECLWFRGQVGGADCNILRSGSVPTKRGQGIDLVANRHVADAVSHAIDDARNLVSRYRG